MRTKRWISFLLCLVFCLTLFPMAALADGDRYLEINETNFPDATFRQWVIDNLAGGKDYMTQTEVGNVDYIQVSGKGIASLKGIKHFSALRFLHCYDNQLTALDVSCNPALTYLDCRGNLLIALDVSQNTALTYFDCRGNQLTALDVSQNTALEKLYCLDNQLTALDVSHNTALIELGCDGNQLTALDVSHNTALKVLVCHSNQLTELDASHNTALTYLDCYSNQLTALDVSQNTMLKWLTCDRNQLTVLDISHNTELWNLDCYSNQLTTLDVSHNTALECLDCFNNQLTALDVSQNTLLRELFCYNNQLIALDVSQNTALKWLNCTGNQLTTLDLSANAKLTNVSMGQTIMGQKLTSADGSYRFDLSGLVPLANMAKVTVSGDGQLNRDTGVVTFATKVTSFTYQYATGRGAMDVTVNFTDEVDSNLWIDETNFPDATFRQWVIDNLAGGKDYMTQAEVESVDSIDVVRKGIASLKGIEHFSALKTLYCYNNQLTTLDVSHNTALQKLVGEHNQLTTLDVSKNTALEYLSCSGNQLTALDVSNNTALKNLYCSDNQLTALDVSQNTVLERLFCWDNQLTTLDVSHNMALTGLDCESNQLTVLDVSQNTALEELLCYNNQLTMLDVSHKTALEDLYCYNNQLTALDVSGCAVLGTLSCYNNQLTALDVSHNTALEGLLCYGNQLTALDVSQNIALGSLYCYDNQLTTLDVSHNTALVALQCQNNQLTTLDVSCNTALEELYCFNNQLTTLDVSHNTALKRLNCFTNQLTMLDVSHNTALDTLNCESNQLTALDVSRNTALEYLHCDVNQLTAVDVSHNTALKRLYCNQNKLTTLDVSRNTALEELWCQNNQLTTLDLSANAKLTDVWMVQTIEGQKLAFANGKYQYDLSQLIPLTNMAKVTVSGDGQLDKATGKVTFTKKVYNFTYQFATGRGDMDVTVRFTDSIASPTITAQPKDVNVKNGEQATFTVKTTGEGNIEYQWYSRPNVNADWALVDGATKDSYTVTGTRDNNGWQFRCRAKNEGGEVYSDAATLTVTLGAPPTIKTQPKSANVKSGSKAKFTVKVKEKGVTYQWFSKAPGAADWTPMAGETKDKLTVVGTKANSGTQYRCRVRTAAGGEAYSNIATLTVKIQPPVIKTQPKSLSVKSGKKAKFTVKASGKNITYQWFGRLDANSPWNPVPGGNKKDLTIVASKANNGSQYYCYLKNADGDATSVTVTLTVTPEAAPTIKTQPKDAKARLGGKAKFKVKASVKNVNYQWYYRTSETGEWVLIPGANSAILTVVAYEDNIGWQFRCRVWNDDGEVYSNAATLRKTVKQPSTAGDAK